MIASMTAFARYEIQPRWGNLSWEVRSVNHRYLEPSFRLPESLRSLEPELRLKLRSTIGRGKVDIQLRFYPVEAGEGLQVNAELLDQLIAAADQVYNRTPAASLDPLTLLQWPGVLQAQEVDLEAVKKEALAAFDQALEELQDNRLREGEALAGMIEERLQAISEHLQKSQNYLPKALQLWRQSLLEKAEKLAVEVDPQRLEQEVVFLAQKQDIAEELERLEAHVKEVRLALTSQKPVGRRLDFLMQEMNREANTLGSKAMSMEMTQISVDLKVLIEQMREQIQNIE